MTICLVVKVQHMTLRVQLRRIGAEVLNGVNMGESFHSKLAVETATKGVKDLVLFLCAMPYNATC